LERGDIYHVDLNPIQGREQAGPRFVLIVSPNVFNTLGTPLVCPITQGGDFARRAGYAVSLSGAGTKTRALFCAIRPVFLIYRRGTAGF
jgi:mRNA-degrading endonuclease toxin of MazEF toxin-antitoxin module